MTVTSERATQHDTIMSAGQINLIASPLTPDMLTPEYAEASREVWAVLSAVNVNEHTETKNGLTYLSWAWALTEMGNRFPTFDFMFMPEVVRQDGTVEVSCVAWLIHQGHVIKRSMWLPVMNFRNDPISEPSSTDVNKAKMRCLTKCISRFGLGSYIYAGEDLPAGADDTPAAAPAKKPAPPKKKAPVKRKEKVAQKDEEGDAMDLDDEIADEEGAMEVVSMMLDLAGKATNVGGLKSFWRSNAKLIDMLDQQFPEAYAALKSGFSEIKASMESEGE